MLNTGALVDSGNALSQAGSVVEKAAESKRSSSPLGRAMSAMTALTLGARLLPAARRLFKRDPLLGALLLAGTLGALALVYSRRGRGER